MTHPHSPILSSGSRTSTRSFDKATVASLSSQQMSRLADDELVEVVRAAGFPFVDESRLRYQDRYTLERLAHLSRQACRNLGHSTAEISGGSTP